MKTNEASKAKALPRDFQGRPYAKMAELKAGDEIQVSMDFLCIPSNAKRIVRERAGLSGLWISCSFGEHFLGDHEGNGDILIGIYKCSPADTAQSEELKK